MIKLIKDYYNFCYDFTGKIAFAITGTLDKTFRCLSPTNNRINENNVANNINIYLQTQQERLNNFIVQYALNNTAVLDRAVLIRQNLASGTYNLIDLEFEALSVRRLIDNPMLLDQAMHLRIVRGMGVITPDQLLPHLVTSPTSPISPNLELGNEELYLLSAQQQIVEPSLNLDDLQEIVCIDSVLTVMEKFV